MHNEKWTFLTNHAHVLLCITANPQLKLREIAVKVGITERSVHGIVNDLMEAGFVEVERQGRCNVYRIHPEKALRHPLEAEHQVAELLRLVSLEQEG